MAILQRAVFGWELEAVEGTAETLVAADMNIEIINPTCTPTAEEIVRNTASANLGMRPSAIGVIRGTMTFDVELKGSGTATTAPAWADLLLGMGFTSTVNTGDVDFDPDDTTPDSYTAGLYQDGILWLMAGCRANGVINLRAGEPAIMSVTVEGNFVSYTAVALPTPSGYDSTSPPRLVSAGFDLGSGQWPASGGNCPAEVTIDLGIELQEKRCVNSSSGIKSYALVDRAITGSMLVEAEDDTATVDLFTDAQAGTTHDLTVQIGSTTGNIVLITAPAVQLGMPTGEAIGKLAGLRIPLKFTFSTGGDDIQITTK